MLDFADNYLDDMKKESTVQLTRVNGKFGLDVDGKNCILRIGPGSAAEHAGMHVGDEILSVEGSPLDGKSLAQALMSANIGRVLTLTIFGLPLASKKAERSQVAPGTPPPMPGGAPMTGVIAAPGLDVTPDAAKSKPSPDKSRRSSSSSKTSPGVRRGSGKIPLPDALPPTTPRRVSQVEMKQAENAVAAARAALQAAEAEAADAGTPSTADEPGTRTVTLRKVEGKFGLDVGKKNELVKVSPGSAAFNAGLATGQKIVAVEGIDLDGRSLGKVIKTLTIGDTLTLTVLGGTSDANPAEAIGTGDANDLFEELSVSPKSQIPLSSSEGVEMAEEIPTRLESIGEDSVLKTKEKKGVFGGVFGSKKQEKEKEKDDKKPALLKAFSSKTLSPEPPTPPMETDSVLKLEHDEHAASMDPLGLARLNLKTYTDEIARLEPLMTPEYRRQEAQDAVAAARKMNKKAKPEEALVALQEAQRARFEALEEARLVRTQHRLSNNAQTLELDCAC